MKTAVTTGLKTYKQVAAENGQDWRTQIDDIAEVINYGKKKGVNLGGVLFNGQLENQKEKEPEAAPAGSDDNGTESGDEEKPDEGGGSAGSGTGKE